VTPGGLFGMSVELVLDRLGRTFATFDARTQDSGHIVTAQRQLLPGVPPGSNRPPTCAGRPTANGLPSRSAGPTLASAGLAAGGPVHVLAGRYDGGYLDGALLAV